MGKDDQGRRHQRELTAGTGQNTPRSGRVITDGQSALRWIGLLYPGHPTQMVRIGTSRSVESRMGAVAWAMRQRSVSHPRSSNRTCGFPAYGSPTGFNVRHTARGTKVGVRGATPRVAHRRRWRRTDGFHAPSSCAVARGTRGGNHQDIHDYAEHGSLPKGWRAHASQLGSRRPKRCNENLWTCATDNRPLRRKTLRADKSHGSGQAACNKLPISWRCHNCRLHRYAQAPGCGLTARPK